MSLICVTLNVEITEHAIHNVANAKWMLRARCHAKCLACFLPYIYFPAKITIKWQKCHMGLLRLMTEKLPRDSAIYFKSSDNNTIVKGQRKEQKNAFSDM